VAMGYTWVHAIESPCPCIRAIDAHLASLWPAAP
jgi:hypothetical protein